MTAQSIAHEAQGAVAERYSAGQDVSGGRDVAAFAKFLDALHVKRSRPYKGLTIFPISVVSREFVKSSEEFVVPGKHEGGQGVRINETGKLEAIGFKNRGRQRAVALDGITVRGATQCRVLGAGAVLEPGESVELPACGTKCGRPEEADEAWKFPKFLFPAAQHRRMYRLDTLARKSGDELHMHQSRMWGRMREHFREAGFEHPTMDVDDLYWHWSIPIDDYAWRHKVSPLQVGMISFIGKDMWFMDLFLNTGLLEAVHGQLVRGYAFDAMMRRMGSLAEYERDKGADFDMAQEVFNSMRVVGYRPIKHGGVEMKDAYYFDNKKVCGTALISGGQLIQLSAYSKDRPAREY